MGVHRPYQCYIWLYFSGQDRYYMLQTNLHTLREEVYLYCIESYCNVISIYVNKPQISLYTVCYWFIRWKCIFWDITNHSNGGFGILYIIWGSSLSLIVLTGTATSLRTKESAIIAVSLLRKACVPSTRRDYTFTCFLVESHIYRETIISVLAGI